MSLIERLDAALPAALSGKKTLIAAAAFAYLAYASYASPGENCRGGACKPAPVAPLANYAKSIEYAATALGLYGLRSAIRARQA